MHESKKVIKIMENLGQLNISKSLHSIEEKLPKESSEPQVVFNLKPKGGKWYAYAIKKNDASQFNLRMPFPEAWAGHTNAGLQEISGLESAIFCHRKRFVFATRTQEDALSGIVKAFETFEKKDMAVV